MPTPTTATEEQHRFARMTAQAVQTHSKAQFTMDTDWMLPYKIDEISILFRYPGAMQRYVDWLKLKGGSHFNAHILDRMARTDLTGNHQAPPSPQHFDVQFEFLRVPGDPDWRIEAMNVRSGKAPLHEALLAKKEMAVAHASFKLDGFPAYRAACLSMGAAGLRQVAAYRNSYGVFSYWSGLSSFYLKPRLNLRDS